MIGRWVVVAVIWVVLLVFYTSLSLFVLEKLSHHEYFTGFEIIAHNATDISKNVKEIIDKKNLADAGPVKISEDFATEFELKCNTYFENYFVKLFRERTQIIPWKITDEPTRILEEWCWVKNAMSSIKGLVLHSFSIFKHLYQYLKKSYELHGFTKEILRDYLQNKNFSEVPSTVVYNPNEGVLLFLRKAEKGKLKKEIQLGFNDLELFVLLFHDVLKNSRMKLINLVINDEIIDPNNFDCHKCMDHVLSENDFTDITKFTSCLVGKEDCFDTKYKNLIEEASSKKFLAKLTGVLAASQIYHNYIPKFTHIQNVFQQMDYLRVLLMPGQMNVYYSQDKHMIIKGGFGCGKSIIAAAMLQKILESLKEGEKLFYICYDPRSELLNQMEKNIQKKFVDKVTPFPNKEGLKLSKIIKHITEQEKTNKINLVVDEYNGEDLDESEAKILNKVFKESLQQEFIVLIAQPIEIKRVVNKITQKKNRFDLLRESMTPHYLTWNMRNSVEIHQLIETTKEVLKGEKTIFSNPKDSKKSHQLIKKENPISNEFVSTQANQQELEFELKPKVKGHLVEISSSSRMGLDEAHAIIGSQVLNDTDGNTTVSSFAYGKVEEIGHKIQTGKPILFELVHQEEFYKNLSLAAIFKKVGTISSKYVVLHFHTETSAVPSAVRFAFEHVNREPKRVITSYKDFKLIEESILVCSYPTFRGLEHPIITVLIDSDIYFVQHYLVEMLARCTSQLYVIVLQNSSILEKVTYEWKNKGLVDNWKTTICTNDFQAEPLKFRMEESNKIIEVIFKTETYNKLDEEFKKLDTIKDETIKYNTEQQAKEVIDQKR